MNQEDYLKTKFPDLRVGHKPGSLGAVNGFGTTLIGRRDFDDETQTYVATRCVTLLFVPLIPTSAFRVADAPQGGWFCIGRVPLSTRARAWNLFLVLALLGGIGGIWWNVHTSSPEYAARQKIKEADRAAAEGQAGQAAKLYREVMEGRTDEAVAAQDKLTRLLEDPPGPPSEAAAVYAVAMDLHRDNRSPLGNPFARGKALAQKYAESDPKAALALLEVIAPYAPDPAAEIAVRLDLLEKLFARDPNDVDTASRLAAACDAKGDRERCEKVLAPFADRLGDRDGAAILGRIHAGRGELDKASALLRPFVDARLPALRAAEGGFLSAIKGAEQGVLAKLRNQSAPGFDYAAYERKSEAQQDAMITEYIAAQLKNDPTIRAARQQLMAQSGVVGAAIDLGLVQLHRGQALADPAARKAELEAAEKTFLSVRGFAGEDDGYRISLGQVYYWLGRAADGKKQFDDLLTSRGRGTDALVRVAGALREVGDVSAARKTAEEAYEKEPDAAKKQRVARTRAVMQIDLDDEILWLGRSNPEDTDTQASLANSRGHKAARDGDDNAAAAQYRRAIDLYAKLPDSAASFNNSALAHFALYSVTLDRAEFTRGMDKLDRAIALLASDSILLSNGVSVVTEGALRDAAGSELDFRALKRAAGWDLIPFLTRGPKDRAAVSDRVLRHPGTVKARSYAEKLMTLAPKRDDSYAALAQLHTHTRNLDGLKAVLARVSQAELDHADETREYRDHLSGASDAKKADEARKGLARTTTALTAAKAVKGRTFAAAVARYLRVKQSVWMYGDAVDADELVKLCEEAVAASPSDGSEWTLQTALLFRAHLSLAKDNPEYAAAVTKTKRSIGTTLVHYALTTDGPLKAAVAANADVKRAAALALDIFARDPESLGPASWALVRGVSPEKAAAVRDRVKADELARVRQQIDRRLASYAAAPVMEEYLWLLVDGKDADAKKVLADAAKTLPLP